MRIGRDVGMNYWSRQQNVAISQATTEIVELIREGILFKDWPRKNQQQLALALFPREHSDDNGEWTEEGRAALGLLKHLLRQASYINAPEELKKAIERRPVDAGATGESDSLTTDAHYLRRELAGMTPPSVLISLLSNQ